MPTAKTHVAVPGSARTALPGAKVVGDVDPQERIAVTVRVRPRVASVRRVSAAEIGAQLPRERQYLSREEFAATRGADPEDLAKIETFAHQHGLSVVQSSIPRCSVVLSGTVAALSKAFGVKLKHHKSGDITYRGRTGPVYVPRELRAIVEGVFGLDNRPAAKPHYRLLDGGQHRAAPAHMARGAQKTGRKTKGGVTAKNAPDGSFSPPEVARLYNFPIGLDGKGQCIALIELNTPRDPRFPTKNVGAGYTMADLNSFFSKLGIPTPNITAVSVDGGANLPGLNPGADGEVLLDIEVAGAVAPGARVAVYFAPNTDQGFLDAITTAIHDNVRKPSVISISWGGPENAWTDQSARAFDQAFQDAAAVGVTVCCASGDNGSDDGVGDGRAHADFPASSPHALGCGGTALRGNGTTISEEVVWNEGPQGGAGGGGISNLFPRPTYQAKAKIPKSLSGKRGRGVPDIAGDADPATGYRVVVGGKQIPIGGTSAVAPLWAGLLALINQKLGQPVGFLNPLLYGPLAAPGVFHDIVSGNNDMNGNLGGYKARKGWDACTGLGTPDGTKILQGLGG